MMPKQKPGKSRQDYSTPSDFMLAVERVIGTITMDLAANAKNAKAATYINSKQNSLTVDWRQYDGLLWLNPPFGDIAPWAKKCMESVDPYPATNSRVVALLTPASVGSNWFMDYVHGKALVYALNPRLTFVGETQPYPKDCMLSLFGFGPGFQVWRWK